MHGVRNWFRNLGRYHNRYISLPGWFCCINSEDRLGPGLGALLAPVLHNLEALLLMMMIVVVMVVMVIMMVVTVMMVMIGVLIKMMFGYFNRPPSRQKYIIRSDNCDKCVKLEMKWYLILKVKKYIIRKVKKYIIRSCN